MTQNETIIRNIISSISRSTLGNGIEMMKSLQGQLPWLHVADRLESIDSNYRLMKEYLSRDIDDLYRGKMYADMVLQLKRLATDALREALVRDNAVFANCKQRNGGVLVSASSVLSVLEGFVQDIAMSSIDFSTTSSVLDVYEKRQGFLDSLFNSILVDGNWTNSKAEEIAQLVLEPTIDIQDAMLIVSAITLAALTVPDYLKVSALLQVYQQAADEPLRQRALVGWVFASLVSERIYPDEIEKLTSSVLKDGQARNEILELAMQVVYCNNAEKDNEYLERNVYPEIIKNRNINITQSGIEEKEDDPMDDILDPGAADRKMEEMEQSVKKMMDMQRSGADIYFGGFKQMKRFSFFYTLSNWFMPFYMNNPHLSHIASRFANSPILNNIIGQNSFCDSDKYSLVLAFGNIYDKLPQNIRETLQSQELSAAIGNVKLNGDKSPAFLRRAYLQDLYRFFKVFPQKGSFDDIFVRFPILLANSPFSGNMSAEIRIFAKFLAKRGINPTSMLLACFDNNSIDDLLLMAYVKMKEGDYARAFEYYQSAYSADNSNFRALKGSALSAFRNSDYDNAVRLYDKLFELRRDEHLSHKLKHCVAMFHTGRLAEGVKELFRLTFEYPDDVDVVRVLAYGLLMQGKAAQALRSYSELLEKSPIAADRLYAAYCHMHLKEWGRAIGQLQRYANGNRERLSKAFADDHVLLVSLGIGDADLQILEDAATDPEIA